MSIVMARGSLVQQLIREGLIPDDCVDFELDFRHDHALMLTYRVLVTDEKLDKFRRAFARHLGMDPDAELPARAIRLARKDGGSR